MGGWTRKGGEKGAGSGMKSPAPFSPPFRVHPPPAGGVKSSVTFGVSLRRDPRGGPPPQGIAGTEPASPAYKAGALAAELNAPPP